MRRPDPSLLETVRRLLERTYRIDCGVGALAPFVIGDEGYRRLYRAAPVPGAAGSADPHFEARTLVREHGPDVRARVYFPDAMIRCLERYPPQRGLGSENARAFATFVEEIDHLLLIAERARRRRQVSLFELELHANVSKHLVLARFLAGRRDRLDERRRVWLRRTLFGEARFVSEDPAERRRYRDAARWAVRMLEALPGLARGARIETLRRFHDAGAADKLALIGRLA